MESYDTDTVVIGAGVVGLACARAAAMAGHEVLVLEKNAQFGEETSARNSEVIHAGIYYDAGSLKARLCVEGRRRLYDFCQARSIGHRRCGKLIVAADESELQILETVVGKAAANGVEDMRPLSRAGTLEIEPALDVAGALLSPATGIVDSHALMLALLAEAEDNGAQLVLNSGVMGGEVLGDGRIALISGNLRLVARHVINAAGLWAQAVSASIGGLEAIPPLALAKGCYFALSGKAPFSRLIYPAPAGGGLGVHLTLDMAGRAKFGPDIEWLGTDNPAALDYTVDPARGDSFYAAIRRYWPGLPDGALTADYSGVRPKIAGGEYPDFRIQGEETHGLQGHVMLYGIESPGLTSCLAIADRVAGLL